MFDQTNNISPLQQALFKAAQVGNVKLMREFIAIGANPFILDSNDRNALLMRLQEIRVKLAL